MNNERPEGVTKKSVKTQWVFGNLIDEDAKKELLAFQETFDRSQNSTTVFIGYTPPNE